MARAGAPGGEQSATVLAADLAQPLAWIAWRLGTRSSATCWMFRVSAAAIGTGLAADYGHEIPGVLAVLVTAGPCLIRPVTLALQGLPGCGVAGAGGVLSGRVLGSGLGSR
jgi:hypothetical protein